jgi:methylmalonyl-CoA mutase N-terminal domain/subunit
MDEALAVPSEEAALIALRTQQILAFEFNIAQTIDPLGGSYFIESLTNDVEEKALEVITKIDQMGGVLAAMKNNYFLKEISGYAWDRQKKINNKEKIVVGVNEFCIEEKSQIGIIDIDRKKVFELVRNRVKKIKQERDSQRFNQAMDNLKKVASGRENIVPALIEAFEGFASTTEINRALREVFGEYKHPIGF